MLPQRVPPPTIMRSPAEDHLTFPKHLVSEIISSSGQSLEPGKEDDLARDLNRIAIEFSVQKARKSLKSEDACLKAINLIERGAGLILKAVTVKGKGLNQISAGNLDDDLYARLSWPANSESSVIDYSYSGDDLHVHVDSEGLTDLLADRTGGKDNVIEALEAVARLERWAKSCRMNFGRRPKGPPGPERVVNDVLEDGFIDAASGGPSTAATWLTAERLPALYEKYFGSFGLAPERSLAFINACQASLGLPASSKVTLKKQRQRKQRKQQGDIPHN